MNQRPGKQSSRQTRASHRVSRAHRSRGMLAQLAWRLSEQRSRVWRLGGFMRAWLADATSWVSNWWHKVSARWSRHWRAARAEQAQVRGGIHFESLEPRILMSADLLPAAGAPVQQQSVAVAADPALTAAGFTSGTFADANGVQAFVSITGQGSAAFTKAGDGYQISVSGTDASSHVVLNVLGTQPFHVTGLDVSSPLADVLFDKAVLSGPVHFAGAVSAVTLGDLKAASLSLQGAGATTLKVGKALDSSLDAPLASVSLSATDWTQNAPGKASISAGALSKLSTTGDLAGDVRIAGLAGSSAAALGSAQIGGQIGAGVWAVHGRVSLIQAVSTSADWRANISGALTQFVTTGDASGQLSAASVQVLQAGGSLKGFTAWVGADLGDDAKLGGSAANADTFKAGTLSRLRVGGNIDNSQILVSVDPANGVLFDGNDKFVSGGGITQELAVGGAFVGASRVVAPAFPVLVKIGGVSRLPAAVSQLLASTPDLVAPTLISAGLAAASDTGALGDLITSNAVVTLLGQTEAGSSVKLVVGAQTFSAVADATTGAFSLANVPLSLGNNAFSFSLTDKAGNAGTGSLSVTRVAEPDLTAPTLSAALKTDSGTAGDALSNTAAITGKATDNIALAPTLKVSLDSAAAQDVATSFAPDGSFELSTALLDQLAGGKLADGKHTVRLIALDTAGNPSAAVDVAFTLDTVAPTASALGLDPASDTGTQGDLVTSNSVVKLVGQAPAGTQVSSTIGGVPRSATADGAGQFSFDQVALSLGANTFSFTLLDAAGNTAQASLTVQRSTAADTIKPTLTAALKADTGAAGDSLTRDPSIAGKATDNVGLAGSLKVSLDGQAAQDVATTFAADGSYVLSAAQLDSLAGGKLLDGTHTVSVVAVDTSGNPSDAVSVSFKLDTAAPAGSSFGIANADALNGDTSQTAAAVVLLTGQAEAGATISYQGLERHRQPDGRLPARGCGPGQGRQRHRAEGDRCRRQQQHPEQDPHALGCGPGRPGAELEQHRAQGHPAGRDRPTRGHTHPGHREPGRVRHTGRHRGLAGLHGAALGDGRRVGRRGHGRSSLPRALRILPSAAHRTGGGLADQPGCHP